MMWGFGNLKVEQFKKLPFLQDILVWFEYRLAGKKGVI
jgi:hypothetical protein